MYWSFTVRINCSSDLKIFANSWPSASNFKSFSRSLEQFFLTVGQNKFGNKTPFLSQSLKYRRPKFPLAGGKLFSVDTGFSVVLDYWVNKKTGNVLPVNTKLMVNWDLRKFWSSLFEALLTWNKTIALFGAKLNFCLWLYDVNLEFISLLNTRRFAKIQPIASFYVHIRHHLRIFQQFPHQTLG